MFYAHQVLILYRVIASILYQKDIYNEADGQNTSEFYWVSEVVCVIPSITMTVYILFRKLLVQLGVLEFDEDDVDFHILSWLKLFSAIGLQVLINFNLYTDAQATRAAFLFHESSIVNDFSSS